MARRLPFMWWTSLLKTEHPCWANDQLICIKNSSDVSFITMCFIVPVPLRGRWVTGDLSPGFTTERSKCYVTVRTSSRDNKPNSWFPRVLQRLDSQLSRGFKGVCSSFTQCRVTVSCHYSFTNGVCIASQFYCFSWGFLFGNLKY